MVNTVEKPFDVVGFIMSYEDGETSYDETINGFQHLIDTGIIHSLQGSYQRAAQNLISRGYCSPRENAEA